MLIKKLFSEASQAKLAAKYRDTRIKISTKIADIYFNKECIKKRITPQYAKIKINCNSTAAKRTKEQGEVLFMQNMIKQLYCEKEELNLIAYDIHLQFLRLYGLIAWNLLHEIVSEEVEDAMDRKYSRINDKLDKLIKKNTSNEDLDRTSTGHKFQKRVINLTDIQFNEEETKIMNYGMKYNFPMKKKDENELLATEVEGNIKSLRDIDHYAVRKEVTATAFTSQGPRDPSRNEELKTCKKIKKKLEDNESIVVKADKSNAIVVLRKEEYIKKTEDFIKENDFKELKKDPTQRYQKELSDVVKKCTRVITEECRQKMNILNSKAPVMKGIPKIHKKNVPIRPLVNFKCAPTYNVSKLLASKLSNDLELEYIYNVKNSYEFVERVKNIDIESNSRLVSFDISNLYTNIPVSETIDIVKCRLLQNGLESEYVNQIVKLLVTVLKQNYFRFNNRFYEQTDGLAMGSPLSAILSEIFLQHQEKEMLNNLRKNHDVKLYVRYVDDILVIFRQAQEQEHETMMQTLNSHHPNLTFTTEFEENQKINFLDLTLERKDNKIEFSIYRKPTQTDTTINSKSIHPTIHKTAAFRSMLYRAYKIPLSQANRKKELDTIKKIAQVNGFRTETIEDIARKTRRKINSQNILHSRTTLEEIKEEKPRYVTFSYTGTTTQRTANKFKKYGVSIAYRTQNTLSKILNPKIEDYDKFDASGIYKINCNDCDSFYIGQTVNFVNRFKNHISAWRNNKPERSNVAQHLLQNGHSLGKIDDSLCILKNCKKGFVMNAWEELYIYKEKCKNRNKLINEQVNFDSSCTFKNVLATTSGSQ